MPSSDVQYSADTLREQMMANDQRRWSCNLLLFAFCVAVVITLLIVLVVSVTK